MQLVKAIVVLLIGLLIIGVVTLLMNSVMDSDMFTTYVPEGLVSLLCHAMPIIMIIGLIIGVIKIALTKPSDATNDRRFLP